MECVRCGLWGHSLFPTGLRFSEDRLFNIAFLTICVNGKVIFAKTPLYYWDLGASGTTGVFYEGDVGRLLDFDAALADMEKTGVVSADERGSVLAAEVSNQFKRFVRLNKKCSNEMEAAWLRVLAGVGDGLDISRFPDGVLGPHRVLRPALVMLLKGGVKQAFAYERLCLTVKRLIGAPPWR